MASPTTRAHQAHPRHPVRVVATRTGLSPHVLRAWERRYAVIAPDRSGTGRRLYSDADIERLILLRVLTAAGESISQLARLSDRELARMARAHGPTPSISLAEAEPWRARALSAIQAIDAPMLRSELSRATLALGVPRFLAEVAAPLLVEVGARWHAGNLGIAEEHLATAVTREVLGWIRESSDTMPGAPVLVIATPAGQMHEGGALLAAAAAAAAGWRVTYLGANLPGREIALAAERTGAKAVALSLIHPARDPGMGAELKAIRRGLPAGVQLLAGGSAAAGYRREVETAGGSVIEGLTAFEEQLRLLVGTR